MQPPWYTEHSPDVMFSCVDQRLSESEAGCGPYKHLLQATSYLGWGLETPCQEAGKQKQTRNSKPWFALKNKT